MCMYTHTFLSQLSDSEVPCTGVGSVVRACVVDPEADRNLNIKYEIRLSIPARCTIRGLSSSFTACAADNECVYECVSEYG